MSTGCSNLRDLNLGPRRLFEDYLPFSNRLGKAPFLSVRCEAIDRLGPGGRGYRQGEDFESTGCKNFDQRILPLKGKNEVWVPGWVRC
jgi:hypothetical protein